LSQCTLQHLLFVAQRAECDHPCETENDVCPTSPPDVRRQPAQHARRGDPAGMAGRCRSPCRSTDHFGLQRCYRAVWTSSLAATLHGPSSGSDQSCICASWIRLSVATGASHTITDGHNRLSGMPCRTFRGPRDGDVAHRYGPNPPFTRRTVAPTQIIRPATITASPREPVLHNGIA
jgi:hypothetical protein